MQTVDLLAAIPNPLPKSHNDLINIFQDVYNKADAARPAGSDYVKRSDIASMVPSKVNMAVMLSTLNYQVENGGFAQWEGNGYKNEGVVIEAFVESAAKMGVKGAEELHAIVSKVIEKAHSAENGYPDSEEYLYKTSDEALYAMENRFDVYQELLDRFDEIVANRVKTFFSSAF